MSLTKRIYNITLASAILLCIEEKKLVSLLCKGEKHFDPVALLGSCALLDWTWSFQLGVFGSSLAAAAVAIGFAAYLMIKALFH